MLKHLLAVLSAASALATQAAAQSNTGQQVYGIAAKRPVVQASCKYCPWGALAEVLKNAMTPYGYDLAVCHTCSSEESARIVSKRLMPPEISARQVELGVGPQPKAPIDFGITNTENVRRAYEGRGRYQNDGPMTNLRAIALIESPAYLLVAADRSSGITDLRQITEKKMPVRLMAGASGGLGSIDMVFTHYGFSRKDIESWGGKVLTGGALVRSPEFDVIVGVGLLSNYPEGSMWYEMTQKKDLVFLPVAEDLRQKIVKENDAILVDLPFRYMRGVGDNPIPTVGFSGTTIYGRDDLPDAFVYDIAKALDEKRDLLRWTTQPFSYDPNSVSDGRGVPLHPGAAKYYRERGYSIKGPKPAGK
jgi:TRAP transporter TAXI family solute receptor